MSFLDNLENSLKSLENNTGREDAGRENDRRKADREKELAIGPWVERLKKSAYTEELMKAATREGYRLRTKVYIAWLGNTLRLDAKEKRLELRPAPSGIHAVIIGEDKQEIIQPIDLAGQPAELIKNWLA